jgi:hypothetical protein
MYPVHHHHIATITTVITAVAFVDDNNDDDDNFKLVWRHTDNAQDHIHEVPCLNLGPEARYDVLCGFAQFVQAKPMIVPLYQSMTTSC